MTKKFELNGNPQTLDYGKDLEASFTHASVYVTDKRRYNTIGTYIDKENAISLAKDILVLHNVPFANRVKGEKK